MKQRLILISGFGGTGKTTVAQMLFEKLDECAIVHADHLFMIKPWAIGEKLGRIKLRNSLDVIGNYMDEQYENVICEGLVWSQAELDAACNKFPCDRYQRFLFWLRASRDVRFDRVVRRGEPGDTVEFLQHVEQCVHDPWPLKAPDCYIEEIDTTTCSAESVAVRIVEAFSTVGQSSI